MKKEIKQEKEEFNDNEEEQEVEDMSGYDEDDDETFWNPEEED